MQIKALTEHVDIYPTLLATQGLEPSDSIQGRSLLTLMTDPTPPMLDESNDEAANALMTEHGDNFDHDLLLSASWLIKAR